MPISLPTDITGCKLWLQGDLGLFDATSGGSEPADGGSVKRWEDQSGNAMHFTEGTAPPTRRNSGVNGARSVRFASASSQFLGLPHASAGVLNTLQTGSYTFCFTADWVSIGTNNCLFAKGVARQIYYAPSATAAFRRNATGMGFRIPTSGDTGHLATATPYIITYTFSLTSGTTGVETFRVNGNIVAQRTADIGSVDTTSDWRVGAGNTGAASFFHNGDIGDIIAYNSVLTSQQILDVEAYLRTRLGISIPHSYESGVRLVCDGDSITYGQGNSANKSWPAQCLTQLGRDILVQNAAIAGSNVSSTLDTGIKASAVDTLSIATVLSGTNAINSGTSAATVYSTIQSWCADARAKGYDKILVFTILPRSGFDATKETVRTTVNQSIRDGFANATLDCDAVADIGADSTLSNPANTTYYQDGTHPTDAGQAVIAGYAATKISPWLPAIVPTAPFGGMGFNVVC
jgi:lysophospholipase L1-like esterase